MKIVKRLEQLRLDVKIYAILSTKFQVGEEVADIFLYSKTVLLTRQDDAHDFFRKNVVEKLLDRASSFELGPSSATLIEVVSLSIHFHNSERLRIGSHIPTPKSLCARAIVNIRNDDDKCFLHCINAQLHPTDLNPHRVSSYPPLEDLELNLKGLTFPMPLKQIKTFEKHNPNYSVHVFGLDEWGEEIVTYYCSKAVKKVHTNLLLLQKEENQHYALISNMSALVTAQLGYKHQKKHFCLTCLAFFPPKKRFEEHERICQRINYCAIKFPPKEREYIEFTNVQNQIRLPFVVYADIECLVEHSTERFLSGTIQKHIPFNVGLYFQSDHPGVLPSEYRSYRGNGGVYGFLQ